MTPPIEFGRSATRCPFCHDGVSAADDWKACAGCLARHHASCWAVAGRCSTCGRREALVPQDPAPPRAPSAWVRALPVVATAVVGLGLGFLVGLGIRRRPALPPPAPPPVVVETPETPVEAPELPDLAAAPERPAPPPAAPPPAPPPAPTETAPDPVSCRAMAIDFDPAHFTVTPDGRYLLLANREANKVVVWDWDKDEEERRIAVDGGPCYVFVRGDRAYVCNGKVATISEIDLAELKVVNTINLPTGQPYYMSSTPDAKAPLFVSCGVYTDRKLVRVDLPSEASKVIRKEIYTSVFTVHTNGKVAIKQGEFSTSPRAAPTVYEMGPDFAIGNQLAYLHTSMGLLVPDRKGRYRLGSGGVWDLSLSKQVAQLDNAQFVFEHPTDPAIIALGVGDAWRPTNQGTVAIYDTLHFTSHFTRPFALPASKATPVAGRGADDFSQPVAFVNANGTTVIFKHRGNMMKLVISPSAYSTGVATRLRTPIPTRIPAGPSWTFKLEVAKAGARPTFKGLELPEGVDVDPSTGELTWTYPTAGEYDLAIKVFVSPEDYFVVEEHVTVENPK